ncbi:hypothetical protein HN587_01785 [Candidatus Woesearchaeota archaeon]|jgi:hypothetical protein|nr:hypothetical protein [Candidatus Woesearchaeota archaeon]
MSSSSSEKSMCGLNNLTTTSKIREVVVVLIKYLDTNFSKLKSLEYLSKLAGLCNILVKPLNIKVLACLQELRVLSVAQLLEFIHSAKHRFDVSHSLRVLKDAGLVEETNKNSEEFKTYAKFSKKIKPNLSIRTLSGWSSKINLPREEMYSQLSESEQINIRNFKKKFEKFQQLKENKLIQEKKYREQIVGTCCICKEHILTHQNMREEYGLLSHSSCKPDTQYNKKLVERCLTK